MFQFFILAFSRNLAICHSEWSEAESRKLLPPKDFSDAREVSSTSYSSIRLNITLGMTAQILAIEKTGTSSFSEVAGYANV